MTPEQRQRALSHYTTEAAVALRIEQLEAQVGELSRMLLELAGCASHMRQQLVNAGQPTSYEQQEVITSAVSLAKAGASHD